MKTSRYLLLKTIWVALFPVFPLHVISPLLIIYIGHNYKLTSAAILLFVPLVFIIWVIIWLIMWFLLRWIKKAIQYEDLPENFVPCLLPWVIPLYYTLFVTFVAYLTAFYELENANMIFVFSQPVYYCIWVLLIESPPINIFSALPLVLSSVMAIVGIHKVLDERPPVKHWQWYFFTPVLVLGIGIILAHVGFCLT